MILFSKAVEQGQDKGREQRWWKTMMLGVCVCVCMRLLAAMGWLVSGRVGVVCWTLMLVCLKLAHATGGSKRRRCCLGGEELARAGSRESIQLTHQKTESQYNEKGGEK